MVGRDPAFQPVDSLLVQGLSLSWDSVYVLSCVVSDGGSDILLVTAQRGPLLSSVLVHSLWLSYRRLTYWYLNCKSLRM